MSKPPLQCPCYIETAYESESFSAGSHPRMRAIFTDSCGCSVGTLNPLSTELFFLARNGRRGPLKERGNGRYCAKLREDRSTATSLLGQYQTFSSSSISWNWNFPLYDQYIHITTFRVPFEHFKKYPECTFLFDFPHSKLIDPTYTRVTCE